MKSRKVLSPTQKGLQLKSRPQPTNHQAPKTVAIQPKAPGITQPALAQSPSRTKAPPVYKPQTTPRVLQARTGGNQPGIGNRGKDIQQPKAPQAYRPQPIPKCMQLKKAQVTTTTNHQRTAAAQPQRTPQAPPVYNPNTVPKVLQTKMNSRSIKTGGANHVRNAPVAPPVYHPQPVPKVLQTKRDQTREATIPQQGNRPLIAPAPDSRLRAPLVSQGIVGRPVQGTHTIQRVKAYHNKNADLWSLVDDEEAGNYPEEDIMDTDDFEPHQFEMFHNFLLSTRHDAFAEVWKEAVEAELEKTWEEILEQGSEMQEEVVIEEDTPVIEEPKDIVGDYLRSIGDVACKYKIPMTYLFELLERNVRNAKRLIDSFSAAIRNVNYKYINGYLFQIQQTCNLERKGCKLLSVEPSLYEDLGEDRFGDTLVIDSATGQETIVEMKNWTGYIKPAAKTSKTKSKEQLKQGQKEKEELREGMLASLMGQLKRYLTTEKHVLLIWKGQPPMDIFLKVSALSKSSNERFRFYCV